MGCSIKWASEEQDKADTIYKNLREENISIIKTYTILRCYSSCVLSLMNLESEYNQILSSVKCSFEKLKLEELLDFIKINKERIEYIKKEIDLRKRDKDKLVNDFHKETGIGYRIDNEFFNTERALEILIKRLEPGDIDELIG